METETIDARLVRAFWILLKEREMNERHQAAAIRRKHGQHDDIEIDDRQEISGDDWYSIGLTEGHGSEAGALLGKFERVFGKMWLEERER